MRLKRLQYAQDGSVDFKPFTYHVYRYPLFLETQPMSITGCKAGEYRSNQGCRDMNWSHVTTCCCLRRTGTWRRKIKTPRIYLKTTPLLYQGWSYIKRYYAALFCTCGLVVRVSGYRSRGPRFDSRRFQIFWEATGLERGPLSLVSITEELLGRNSSGSG
jgi:hypothetical protein